MHGAFAGAWVGIVSGSAEAVLLVGMGAEPPIVFWGAVFYGLIGLLAGLCFGFFAGCVQSWPFKQAGSGAALAIVGATVGFTLVVFRLLPQLRVGSPVEKLQDAVCVIAAILLVVTLMVSFVAPWFGDKVGRSAALPIGTLTLNGIVVAACVNFEFNFYVPTDRGFLDPVVRIPDSLGDKPNTLFIVVNGLRRDVVSIYNRRMPPTRSFERIQRDGVVFDVALSTSSATAPAMASLWTGRMVRHHGVKRAGDELGQRIPTLFEAQQRAGVHTAAVVSHPELTEKAGFGRGFDHFVTPRSPQGGGARVRLTVWDMRVAQVVGGVVDAVRAPSPYQYQYRNLDYRGSPRRDRSSPYADRALEPIHAGVGQLVPDVGFGGSGPTVSAATQYLRAKRHGRWSLLVQLGSPVASPGPFSADEPDERYVRGLQTVDSQIQQILAELELLGLYDDTLIVITSDHGTELGDHDGFGVGETLFDEMLLVPLVMKMPARAYAGTRYVGQVRALDAFVTAMDVQRVRIPKDVAGRVRGGERSLVASFSKNRAGVARDDCQRRALMRDRFAYGQVRYGDTVVRSFRSSGYKLIEVTGPNPRGLQRSAFYDLFADPNEEHDLSESDATHCRPVAGIRRDMKRLIAAEQVLTSRGLDYDLVDEERRPVFDDDELAPEATGHNRRRRLFAPSRRSRDR